MRRHYSHDVFSITMVTELPDGTSVAETVKVLPNQLDKEEYQDDLYDRVADTFGRLVGKWEDNAKKGVADEGPPTGHQ